MRPGSILPQDSKIFRRMVQWPTSPNQRFDLQVNWTWKKARQFVLNLAGGSAAQNPTIQLLDILLDVKHADEPEYALLCNWDAPLRCCPVIRSSGCNASYKGYEGIHAKGTSWIFGSDRKAKIDARFKLSAGYQACIKELANFRSEHIKMVSRYIVCQNSRARGTGGSNPIPFKEASRWYA